MYNIYSEEHSEAVANSPGVDEQTVEKLAKIKAIIDEQKERRKPVLYVMVGLPGSGKTWHIRNNPILSRAVRVSHDDIYAMINTAYDKNKRDIYHRIEDELVRLAIHYGFDVVVDRTCLDRETRGRFIAMGKWYGAGETIAIVMNNSIETAKKRNQMRPDPVPDDVYDRLLANATKPTKTEGFTEIIMVNNE